MNKRWVLALLLLNLLFVGGVLAQDGETGFAPTAEASASPWTQVPVEGAVCARGTPYSFFVREGNPEKLMVYFQGGGACWNAETCKPGGPFDDDVGANELGYYGGIFDFANPQNPIADFSVVVVTYCTADVHTGGAVRSYTVNGADVTIHFAGAANAQAVLDWVYGHYDAPGQLLVAGSSAGAYGAIFNAPYLLAHYPDARAVVLGDAGIGVVPADWDGFQTWNTPENLPPELQTMAGAAPQVFTNSLYAVTAAAFPTASIAQYTSASDAVQIGFYRLMSGAPDAWKAGLAASFARLDALDNFRSYVGWGSMHTALATPVFYLMQVDGVTFRDWFAGLLDGTPVENIACDDCVTAVTAGGN